MHLHVTSTGYKCGLNNPTKVSTDYIVLYQIKYYTEVLHNINKMGH